MSCTLCQSSRDGSLRGATALTPSPPVSRPARSRAPPRCGRWKSSPNWSRNARGIYSGAVGYVDFAGNLDFCIAIRTIVIERGLARLQAGAGIVADSVPATEYDETCAKARALVEALELASSSEW